MLCTLNRILEARANTQRAMGCLQQAFMHGARRDVSTGHVLRGGTCFLEELTRDCLPRVVSDLSELTSQKADPRKP